MIICEREIQALLEDGHLVIDPQPPVDSSKWSSTAVDLTLHDTILRWLAKDQPTGSPTVITPHSKNFDVQGMMENGHFAEKTNIAQNGYILNPGQFVLGYTKEKVRFPNRCRIAARVEGKSSLARLGVGVHVTAPTIHAGFGAKSVKSQGTNIQLEIFNLGPWKVRLDAGMRICQLIFEEVREVPASGYRGQFSEQQAFTVPGS